VGDDLVLISWNVEKKSLSGLLKDDTADLIAGSIADTVKAMGSAAENTPFVAYLLEVKGSPDQTKEICNTLRTAYKKKTGQDIEVVANDLGGGEYTTEAIVTMSRGVNVTNSELDLQPKITEAVQADQAEADVAFQQKTEARASRKRKATPDWLEAKPEHFRANVKEPEWFRNGVFSDIRLGGTKLQASVVHSPAPDFVKKFPQSVDAARDTAAESSSDVLIGDFNRDGEFAGEDYADVLRPFETGTTFSKKAAKSGKLELGPRMRDRVFLLKHPYSEWRFTPHEPIIKGRNAFEASLTDHAMICVGATPKSKLEVQQYIRGMLGNPDDAEFEQIIKDGDIGNRSYFKDETPEHGEDMEEPFLSSPRPKKRKIEPRTDSFSFFGNNTNAHNATPDEDYDALEEEETGLLSSPFETSSASGQSQLLSDPVANPTSNLLDTPPTTATNSDAMDTTGGEAADGAAMDTDEVIAEVAEIALAL